MLPILLPFPQRLWANVDNGAHGHPGGKVAATALLLRRRLGVCALRGAGVCCAFACSRYFRARLGAEGGCC